VLYDFSRRYLAVGESASRAVCFAGYRGLLEQVRWSQWCITEDAEHGLPGHWIGEAGTARALPMDCGVATAPPAEQNATPPPIARQHT